MPALKKQNNNALGRNRGRFSVAKRKNAIGDGSLFTEAYNWEDIAPYKTYIFAVRSVNGKKYSAWKTVAVKTGPGPYEQKVLTSAGQSAKMNLGKTSVTFTIGKQCTVPMPTPKKGTLAAKPLSVIPAKIQYDLVRDKAGNSEEVVIEGKMSDGRSVYCRLSTDLGYYDNINYSIGTGASYSTGGKYTCEGLGYGPGYYGKKYTIQDPNTSVVWTTDGTEPLLGQADKSINGSEYPFSPVTSNSNPYNGSVQVRGGGDGSNSSIWGELKRALFNKCEWVRVYDKNNIVGESFFYEGFYN